MIRRYRIPGRIELVGKHVDYGGGCSLTCAVTQALSVTATELDEPILRLRSAQQSQALTLDLRQPIVPPGSWGTYAAAAIRRLGRDFPPLRQGLDLTITADLPADAGLSSSSALVVAIAMAIVDRLDLRRDKRFQERIPDRLAEAEYYGALETGAPFRDTAGDHGVGVAGGAQDSVAILCAEQGACGLYHYLPARLERQIPWPDTHVLAVAVSGVRASKIGNARDNYNRTAHALRSLLAALNAQHGTAHRSVAAALGSDPEALPALQQLARSGVDDLEPRYLSARLQQFVEETGEIVPAAAAALEAGDLSAFGHWVARSQTGAEQGLGNQVQETIFLARSALEHGAVAASAFGAGFGGAVWAMIARQDAASFQAGWAAGYRRQFPEHAAQAQFFLTSPAASAARLLPDE